MPRGTSTVETLTFGDPAPTPSEQKEEAFAGVAVSDGATNHFAAFVGPKDVDVLQPSIPSSNSWWISAGSPSWPSRCS